MCPGFPLVSVGVFFPYLFSKPIALMTEISGSPNNKWLHSVRVLKVLYYLYLQLSSLQMKVLSTFSVASHDMQDRAPQDSCLWALIMQSWTEIFFSFFILIVYLQNRFQQLKSIYGLMEKASVGGFLALKEWEPHQRHREESMDYSHKAGQGAQGK